MRIHSQQTIDDHDILLSMNFKKLQKKSSEDSLKKQTCTICGKDFRSKKSLSGHMRCHPERDCREIQRPNHEEAPETSSSSSSLLPLSYSSDHKSPKIDDHDQMEILADDEKIWTVDLMELVQEGWSMKARRGRKSTKLSSDLPALQSTTSSSEVEHDDQVHEAATDLMTLVERARSMMRDGITNLKHKEKIEKLGLDEENGSNEVEKTAIVVGPRESVNKLDGHDLIKNKRKKKVIKLCDLESPMNDKVGAATGDQYKYKCNSCEKSFLSHQALGGHISSHNKRSKLTTHNTVDSIGVSTRNEASHACGRVMDFDLNVKLPSDDEGGFELGN